MPASPTSPASDPSGYAHVGLVAIGRNEGERLGRCLASVQGLGLPVVYVDSGSTDGSVELARARGAAVHELDLDLPFTAARARNAGWHQLLESHPDCRFVQFVDGDCELVSGWIATATAALEANERLAAVCGRRRERYPEASLYNKLCDLEWDTPVGEALECGGDVLMRVAALQAAGGYDANLIAGEEPELCVRLRAAGWTIERLDAEMTLHDAALDRLGQWWQRTKRCGYTYAAAFARYGMRRESRYARSVLSVLVWALAFPLLVIAAAGFSSAWGRTGWALTCATILLAGYARLVVKIARGYTPDTGRRRDAWIYACACVAGKWPELAGIALFARNRLLGRQARLIEYKGLAASERTDRDAPPVSSHEGGAEPRPSEQEPVSVRPNAGARRRAG